jgi:hypothetical protein
MPLPAKFDHCVVHAHGVAIERRPKERFGAKGKGASAANPKFA